MSIDHSVGNAGGVDWVLLCVDERGIYIVIYIRYVRWVNVE